MNKRQRKKWAKQQLAQAGRSQFLHVVEGLAVEAAAAVLAGEQSYCDALGHAYRRMRETLARGLPQPDVIGYEYPTGTPVFAGPRHHDDIPDDTTLPLDEWNRRVDALLAECAARAQEQP